MAKEYFENGSRVIMVNQEEAVLIIALLSAQLANVSLPGRELGESPTLQVYPLPPFPTPVDEGFREYFLTLGLKLDEVKR